MKNSAIVARYAELRPTYELFCMRLKPLIEELLKHRGIQFQVVEARAKTIESFSEKTTRKGKGYRDALNEITDLAGIRIIVYYNSDVDEAARLLHEEFEVDDARSVDKRMELAPDQFGYISLHKIVQLSRERAKLLEWRSCASLTAEVQIRTVLQHAWAAIDHALKYKAAAPGTNEFTRRLVRLSGLLELADEEFAALRVERQAIQKKAGEQVAKGDLDIPLDTASLVEYLTKSRVVSRIVKAAESAGLINTANSHFELAEHNEEPEGQDLVGICKLLGIARVRELEGVLQAYQASAEKFFSAFMSKRASGSVRGSPAHFAAMLIAARTVPRPSRDVLQSKTGWMRDYCERLLAAAAEK